MERVQKLIANAGHCSRRKAEDLIEQGLVTVNGKTITIGDSATREDDIRVEGHQIRFPKLKYYLLYKPVGYETTVTSSSKRRRTIMSLLNVKERVVPAGRLDYDSSGALLLTNDGELAHRVMHPRYPLDKVYEVVVNGRVVPKALEKLRNGVELREGMTQPCTVTVKKTTGKRTILEFILNEGKNRQIRRMMEAVGYTVDSLERKRIGFLSVNTLKPGKYRSLRAVEIAKLKELLGLHR